MSANWSRHFTLLAGVQQTFEATEFGWTNGTPRLRIINRDGAGEIYATVSVDPNIPAPDVVALQDDSYVLPAVIAEEFIPLEGLDRYFQVKVVSTEDTNASIVFDSAHRR